MWPFLARVILLPACGQQGHCSLMLTFCYTEPLIGSGPRRTISLLTDSASADQWLVHISGIPSGSSVRPTPPRKFTGWCTGDRDLEGHLRILPTTSVFKYWAKFKRENGGAEGLEFTMR